jgi:diguanylate cyclase (GGDEF)-like protein
VSEGGREAAPQSGEHLRLVKELRARQELLDQLSTLQRSIVDRVALPEVLDGVAAGTRGYLDVDVVALRLISPEDPSTIRLVTSLGASQHLLRRWRNARPWDLLSGDVLESGRLAILERTDPERAAAEFAAEGVSSAMIAPLEARGEVIGTLAAGSLKPERRFDSHDVDGLAAFAKHASLAVNDARASDEATHEAYHDSLTGLPNRSLFIDRLRRALARMTRDRRPVAVLFCDLDGFKTVNDSLGHAAGDRLLSAVAARLKGALRPTDTVARFGGDEFAVLLQDVWGVPDATAAATRLLDVLRPPFEVSGREVFVGASIGVAMAPQNSGADEILRNADLAMYRAKAAGRDRYSLFEPVMHTEAVRKMELEGDLARAIERAQLVLHYQPIFDLASGNVTGVEALLRWRHPKRGLIKPNDFIPIAEESRQIRDVGRWVLATACRQLALWRAKYPAWDWLFVNVNLSGIQLQEPELIREVASALRSAQLEPENLMVEMTETVLMEDTEANGERLSSLRNLGVRLAIDDFGTGYSSLEYLDRFPIDALKIAKPFVDRLGSRPGAEAIPRAIVDLAEIFGLAVIAEGIERADQPEALVELGCEFGQGNHLAPPLPPEEADSRLFGAGLLGSAGSPKPPRVIRRAEPERADS